MSTASRNEVSLTYIEKYPKVTSKLDVLVEEWGKILGSELSQQSTYPELSIYVYSKNWRSGRRAKGTSMRKIKAAAVESLLHRCCRFENCKMLGTTDITHHRDDVVTISVNFT